MLQESLPKTASPPLWQRLARLRLLWGTLAVFLAVVAQQFVIRTELALAGLFYALAVVTGFFALAQARDRLPIGRILPSSWSLQAWGGLAIALLALALAGLSIPNFQEAPTPMLAWWLHIASLLAFVGGVALLDRSWTKARSEIAEEETRSWSMTEILALSLIVLIGAVLRLYRLGEIPFGTWYDEANAGLQALRMLNEPLYRPIFDGTIHAPSHYVYMVAAAFKLFGPSTASIRLASAVLGIATVLAAYLAGREFFGRRILGLVLAFLLAVSSWDVNFSRIGMFNIATPLFQLLAIGFLLRGLRQQRLLFYALAGLSLGFGLAFYRVFQLFLPVVGIFFLHAAIARRQMLRRSWGGWLLVGIGLILAILPVLVFAYEQPDIFFARTQDTYIFSGKAPDERIPALIENVRKHVLMFHYRGDPNGRHNLPGSPMLDPITGALMVLGLVLSLRFIWQPTHFLLIVWVVVMLLGGILSLDFEAPQSLRAIGTLSAAYLLAVVPIDGLWRAWRQTRPGQRYPRLFVWPLLAVLIYIAGINIHMYFVRQANDFAVWNAHSTPETLTANLLLQEGDEADFYVTSYFHGHPAINFLARGHQGYQRLETTTHLPLRINPERDVILVMNAESKSIYDQARRYYPDAEFQELGAPFGGPKVVYAVRLTPEDIQSLQGLNATYYATPDWRGDPVLTRKDLAIQFDWADDPPLEGDFSVEWKGVLNVVKYGPYRLTLRAPAAAELYLDEELLLSGEGESSADVVLAQGNHAIRLRAVGGAGPVELLWQAPGSATEVIPPQALYVPPITNNGLLGNYYANGNWEEPVALAQIDPELKLYFHVPMLPRPYTVEWIGKIHIAVPGFYRFGLESIDESVLFINETKVTEATVHNQYTEGSIELSEGLHDIRVRLGDRTGHTHINLYWVPPGRGQSHVPAEVLFPPQGNYEHIQLADADTLFAEPVAPALDVSGQEGEFPRVNVSTDVLAVDLAQPRGLAVAPDGDTLYVADAQTVLVLDRSGRVQKRVQRGQDRFMEITDLATGPDGEIFVLDAGRARISVLNAEGEFVRDVPTDEYHTGRSRGLFVDDEGHIWIANTPNGQVVELAPDGSLLQTVPLAPGQETQPVDVAVTASGVIYATDVATNQLFRIQATASTRQAWSIPVANSGDGPHLALDENDTLLMTAPEPGLILKLGADGEQAAWVVPWRTEVPPKLVGIAVAADGTVWVSDSHGSALISTAGN